MNPRLLPLLILLMPFSAFPQHVKVKKGTIYLNKVKMYNVVPIIEPGLNKLDEKAILSIDNDTLIWLRRRELVNAKADQESEERILRYWEMELVESDSVISYVSTEQDDLYKDLLLNSLLSNQSVDMDNYYLFLTTAFEKTHTAPLFKKAIAQRQALMALDKYAQYAKGLAKRSPNAELSISNDIILFEASEGGPPVSVGKVELGQDSGTYTEYNVYRSSDQRLVAVLRLQPYDNRCTIETEFDGAETILEMRSFDLDVMLKMGVRYLTDAGFL